MSLNTLNKDLTFSLFFVLIFCMLFTFENRVQLMR